jgi:C-terminal processing protease CtpA/Prc
MTISSGSLVAAYLKYYNNAEVIGSESGGTYTGNNGRSFPEVLLPNSKINVRLPLFYINYFPGVPNYGRGVAVDAQINPLLDRKSQEQIIQNQLLNNVE